MLSHVPKTTGGSVHGSDSGAFAKRTDASQRRVELPRYQAMARQTIFGQRRLARARPTRNAGLGARYVESEYAGHRLTRDRKGRCSS